MQNLKKNIHSPSHLLRCALFLPTIWLVSFPVTSLLGELAILPFFLPRLCLTARIVHWLTQEEAEAVFNGLILFLATFLELSLIGTCVGIIWRNIRERRTYTVICSAIFMISYVGCYIFGKHIFTSVTLAKFLINSGQGTVENRTRENIENDRRLRNLNQ